MGDEAPKQTGEVLEHPLLVFVDASAAGRVRRVDAADAVDHAGLDDDLAHLVGDVRHVKAAARPELPFTLVDLHCCGV